jgi:hypothetical protein
MKRPQYDLITIEEIKQKVNQIFQSHSEIILTYLYGSYAQGHQTKFSDIDIGIVLKDNFQEKSLYFAQLNMELEKAFEDRINADVRILNRCPPRFLFQVIKHGVLLHCKDKTFKDEFEIKVITEYIDIKPLLDHFDNLFLREVYEDES